MARQKLELNPGHWHEATDRTHIIILMINDFLIEHPAIMQSPEIRKLCQEAGAKLGEAYQLCGSKM